MSNGYYDYLLNLPEYWKSYSLRDNQYSTPAITYDLAMDASKVTIPAFFATGRLEQFVNSFDTVLQINTTSSTLYPAGRIIRIDSEIMTVVQRLSNTEIEVTRGTFGTTGVFHEQYSVVTHSTNSLRFQSRLPLETTDNHRYVFIWDSYWDSSYINCGHFTHKCYQFSDGSDNIWLEPGCNYGNNACSSMIGLTKLRSYNQLGGPPDWSLSNGNQLGPGTTNQELTSSSFCIAINKWTRFFLVLDQIANNYDPVSLYIADETRDPILIANNRLVSVRPNVQIPNIVRKFWIEMNASDDHFYRLDLRNLVSYVKNLVVLKDLYDLSKVLIKPESNFFIPMKPKNARMIYVN